MNEYGCCVLMMLMFLKFFIFDVLMRRNAGAEWSIRSDVFDMRFMVGCMVFMDLLLYNY